MIDETVPPRSPILPAGATQERFKNRSPSEARELPIAIGPYRVIEKLGEGGMGVVYKCRDEGLNRLVAVKLLHERYAMDEHYRRRFQREAQTIASLSHPCVAQVHAIGETSDSERSSLYIVMEHVEGFSVEALLHKGGALPLKEALRVARSTAMGLREALARNIIHRDIKPSNLLVTASGGVKIVDFGLAKELTGRNSLTDDGIVLGTPHYISPEQGRGRPVDHRSDVYSLGATFYHMVTGRPPFERGSHIAVIVAHVNETPVPPHQLRKEVPLAVSRVLCRMLEKSPEARYSSYDDLIEDLEALERGEGPIHAEARAPQLEETQLLPTPGEARAKGRPERARKLAAALAVGIVAGAAVVALFSILDRRAHSFQEALGASYRRLEDGREVLHLDFASHAASAADRELYFRLLRWPQGLPADGSPPRLQTRLEAGLLCWESFTQPFALGVAFAEVDEVQLALGETTGSFDLGVALLHPAGSERRSLNLRLRPSGLQLDPILALRHNEPALLHPSASAESASGAMAEAGGGSARAELNSLPSPLPAMRRLGQGPLEIFWSFARLPGANRTRMQLRIASKSLGQDLYQASCELEGTDWASGVLALATPSPVLPFSVCLRSILVKGKTAPQTPVEQVPWRS